MYGGHCLSKQHGNLIYLGVGNLRLLPLITLCSPSVKRLQMVRIRFLLEILISDCSEPELLKWRNHRVPINSFLGAFGGLVTRTCPSGGC